MNRERPTNASQKSRAPLVGGMKDLSISPKPLDVFARCFELGSFGQTSTVQIPASPIRVPLSRNPGI